MSTFTDPRVGHEHDVDEELDELVKPGPESTPYDWLTTALDQREASEPLVLAVPGVPGVKVRYRTDAALFTDAQVAAWADRAADDKKRPAGFTMRLHLNAQVLVAACTAILVSDVEQTDEKGRAVTFGTQSFRQALAAKVADPAVANSALRAVRALYGADPFVLDAGGKVLDAAGYGVLGPNVDEEGPDPTEG